MDRAGQDGAGQGRADSRVCKVRVCTCMGGWKTGEAEGGGVRYLIAGCSTTGAHGTKSHLRKRQDAAVR